ncbi:hypothetical protein TIFTF001_041680 [Ficus carica]|uniref:Uncharacterized protein n=1 Tax=Ficus carica TaxID=3494 RepID=A0AA88CVM2_FICCA|nr:hypothetical protein TIFTF001_041680 [Ficus carica]
MMASKLPCVVPICHEGGFDPWFELNWTGCHNHSMAVRHARPATLPHLASEIARRLLTYSTDVRRELSLSKYNYVTRDTNNY